MTISKADLKAALMEYFSVDCDSYFYVLTRVKTAFAVGTMSFDDFEEFSEDIIDDLVNHLAEALCD